MISIGTFKGNVVINITEGDKAITQFLSIEAANIMAKKLVDSVKEVKEVNKKATLRKSK